MASMSRPIMQGSNPSMGGISPQPAAAGTPPVTPGNMYNATNQYTSGAGNPSGNYSINPAAGGNPLNPTFSNYNVSPAESISLFQQGMAPGQWQADRNAMQAAAASGLSGGPLNQVVTDANMQYLVSQYPELASLVQGAQSLGVGQSEFNANAANTAGANQAYLNQNASQGNQNSIWSLLAGLGSAFG